MNGLLVTAARTYIGTKWRHRGRSVHGVDCAGLGILAYRDDQLRRLRAYHAEVGTRLNSIGRVNAFARSLGKSAHTARVLDGQY